MSDIDRLLGVASAEIGVSEDPLGSNNVKYNTAYYGREVSGDKYPWCMAFVWWCFREAGLSEFFYGGGKTASCTTLMKWAKQEGLFVTGDYLPGDVFFYDQDGVPSDSEHTGIYTGERSGERYKAIEGNYANRVCSVMRKPDCIVGAFRAKWSEKQPVIGVTVTLPELSKGSIGRPVTAMQVLLLGYGFRLPRYGADGDFGSETLSALQSFQKSKGLTADGVCGVQTWSMLLGVS